MAATHGDRKTNHRTRVGRERSARTEAKILAAALGVFAERGPDAPTIDDFVAAADISRGTFYNYFDSVDALRAATSAWTTRELLHAIESALEGIDGPVLRFGVGLRLFFAKAQADHVWSMFVARVWKMDGLELPVRDLEAGFRLGLFRAPSPDAMRDVLFGAVREALFRIGTGGTPRAYADDVAALCLQALGVDARRIAAVMRHALPVLARSDVDAAR